MNIFKLVNGNFSVNTYVIGVEDKSFCYIIDPGVNPTQAIKTALNYKKVKGILLTHGHFDHTSGVDACVEVFKCPVFMNLLDIPHVDGTYIKTKQMPESLSCIVNSEITDCFKLKDDNIIIYETPGHTKGSVSYYFTKENVLFTGDALFKDSIGRTDLPGGSNKQSYETICFFKSLKDNITVYPGHEEETTIGREKLCNSYLLSI